MLRSFKSQAAFAATVVAAGAILAGMVPVSAGQTGEPDAADVAAARVIAAHRAEGRVSLPACELATWPYLPAECLRSADGKPVPSVRWVTIEARFAADESALIATPRTE